MSFDNPQNDGKVLRVGDTIVTAIGEKQVTRIVVTPLPSTDVAGEDCGVAVEAVELAHVPAVVDFDTDDGRSGWMYGSQINARRVAA